MPYYSTHTGEEVDDAIENRFKPNLFINGGLDVWQRGESFTVATGDTAFTADLILFDNASAPVGRSMYVDRVAVPYEVTQIDALRAVALGGAPSTGKVWLGFGMEDIRPTAGKKVTVSFLLASQEANLEITPSVYQYFGVGGTAGFPHVDGSPITHNTGSESQFVRYSVTFDTPDIIGDTVGTQSNFFFWLSFQVRSPHSFKIAQVKVEEGAVATPFVTENPADVLARCQRYYREMTAQAPLAYEGGVVYATGPIDVRGMAIQPVLTLIDPLTREVGKVRTGGGIQRTPTDINLGLAWVAGDRVEAYYVELPPEASWLCAFKIIADAGI